MNCGDTIMLDLKELNIVKVRFLKKLLNDNQMKGKSKFKKTYNFI